MLKLTQFNGFGVLQKAAAAAVCTALPANTKLLVHSDTTDGSTVFDDSSTGGHILSAVGGAQHDTDNQKFGASSFLFGGGSDAISATNSSDFNFGTDDFTIAFWANWTNGISGLKIFTSLWYSGRRSWMFAFDRNSNQLKFFYTANGVTAFNVAQSFSPVGHTQYHIAITRKNGTAYMFVDGVELGSAKPMSTDFYNNTTDAFYVGAQGWSGTPINGFAGNMDEYILVKGAALWTEDFTPPPLTYCSAN